MIVFASSQFAIPSLDFFLKEGCQMLIVTKPDKPSGRGKQLKPTPVKKWGVEHLITVLEPEHLKGIEFFKKLSKETPDLIYSAAYGSYIPLEILKLPKLGAVNLHPSLLPLYRGAAPVQRALISGAVETGVTLAYMTEKWDQGEILAQKKFPISEDDDAGTLLEKLAAEGVSLIEEILPRLLEGKVASITQDDSKATYASVIKKEETWIQWEKSAEEVKNQIRGLSPEPGARTLFQGKQVKILKAKIWEENKPFASNAAGNEIQPGVIYRIESDGPVVFCGRGSLLLLKVQPESRNVLNGKDFVNGQRVHVSQQFEN